MIDETEGVGLPNINSREEFSQVVCREQESRQESVLPLELKDFIRQVVVPILVER
jgi:hypothetical protein